MTVRVIVPPEPIVTPADIPGSHASNDAAVARAIAAATRTIDGPSGWLGRALGPQTLELAIEHPCSPIIRLPLPPAIEVLSAWSGDDPLPVDQYQPGAPAIGFGMALMAGRPVRIIYRAGYDGELVEDGGTGDVPPEAIEAIILLVQDRLRVGALDAGLRSETVEGVGATTYLDADRFSDLAQRAASNLLSGLRVYA